ncbi:MAG: hypothetical protein U1D55_02645 [Phycisphaerae bacterium]
MIQAREAIVVAQTRCKVQIRALLLRADSGLKRGKSGWTQGSLEALRQCTRPLRDCQPDQLWRGILGSYLDQLDLFRKQLAECDQKLEAWARHDPRPAMADQHSRRRGGHRRDPRRGSGRRASLSQSAAGGRLRRIDAARFQSGSIDRQGRISKRGNPLLRGHCAEQKAAPLRSGLGWGVSPRN